jgi:hypothetical protein
MTPLPSRWLMPAALCAAAFSAAAQIPPSAATKADPLDPAASVPAAAYASAFDRYRRSADSKAVAWRDANDTTARIGGWRAYAREAQQPDPAPSAPAVAPATAPATPPSGADGKAMPTPHGHHGHKMP